MNPSHARYEKFADVATMFESLTGFSLFDTCFAAFEVGSRSFNMHLDDSDRDYLFVVIPPMDHVLRVDRGPFESRQFKTRDMDVTVYSLQHYMALLAKGNPSVVYTLFNPRFERYVTKAYLELHQQRRSFLSRATAEAALGHVRSNLRRVNRSPDPFAFGADFDTKAVAHAVRLLDCAEEILRGQEPCVFRVGVPRDGTVLRWIRRGLWTAPEAKQFLEQRAQDVETLCNECLVPAAPDKELLSSLNLLFHRRAWFPVDSTPRDLGEPVLSAADLQ